jgi:hypothetical protein
MRKKGYEQKSQSIEVVLRDSKHSQLAHSSAMRAAAGATGE